MRSAPRRSAVRTAHAPRAVRTRSSGPGRLARPAWLLGLLALALVVSTGTGAEAAGILDGALPVRPTRGAVVELVSQHEETVADVLLGLLMYRSARSRAGGDAAQRHDGSGR